LGCSFFRWLQLSLEVIYGELDWNMQVIKSMIPNQSWPVNGFGWVGWIVVMGAILAPGLKMPETLLQPPDLIRQDQHNTPEKGIFKESKQKNGQGGAALDHGHIQDI
jgi:hypothetical protein